MSDIKLSKRAEIKRDIDGIKIYYYCYRGWPRSFFIIAILGVIAFFVWHVRFCYPYGKKMPLIFPIFFSFFPTIFSIYFFISLFSKEELLISEAMITYRVYYPWGWGKQKQIPLGEIEDILVTKKASVLALPEPLLIIGRQARKTAEDLKTRVEERVDSFPSLSESVELIKSSEIIRFGSYLTMNDKLKLRKYIISMIAKT